MKIYFFGINSGGVSMNKGQQGSERVPYRFFRRLIEELLKKFTSEALEVDLSMQEHYIIEVLGRNERLTISNLADQVTAPLTTVSSTLDRLYNQGLVERERSQEDRRVVEVCLSAEGEKIYENHQEETKKFVDEFLSQLSPDDRDELYRILSEFKWN